MPLHHSPAHWFRIAYAPGALLRSLEAPLGTLTPRDAVAAMLAFQRGYLPQHAELDELGCTWGTRDGVFVFALERRMRRHSHAEATLSLELSYTLTPARSALTGTALVATGRDATSTPGYRAIARAVVLDRATALRGGESLSS